MKSEARNMESGLLKEISGNPPYIKGLIKQAIRTGYSNEKILEAISGGIENDIEKYRKREDAKTGDKSFPLNDRLALKRTYRNRRIRYEMIQIILTQKDLPEGKKLHYYLKAVNLPELSDLDTLVNELKQKNDIIQ